MAHRFQVADVAVDRAPLPTRDATELLGTRGFFAVEAAGASRPFVACPGLHGLLMAAHLAFTGHRPLVLSPDHVWIAIAQGLARHVAAHAEALRPRLVRHQGTLLLEVERNDWYPGRPGNDWPGVFDALTGQVRQHLGGRADLCVASFSTTDPVARAASAIVLLDAVQGFFRYGVSSLCGIPEVTLRGTEADWADVRRRARVLGELDLGGWAEALDPWLAEMEAAAGGRPDRTKWLDFYKLEHASGGEEVSGWINVLFPFVGDTGTRQNAWFTGGGPLDLPKLGSFPSGLATAPFVWRFPSGALDMSFVAGFVGVHQDPSGAVEPGFGWAVVPRVVARRFQVSQRHDGVKWLHPLKSQELSSLEGLAAEVAPYGPFALDLGWCRKLASLAPLQGLGTLQELSIMECDLLTSLDDLRDLPGLRTLHVAQCPNLRDVSALAALDQLENVSLSHCPALTDRSPLAALPRLHTLTVWEKSLPEGVRGRHTAPEAIAAAQRGLRALR